MPLDVLALKEATRPIRVSFSYEQDGEEYTEEVKASYRLSEVNSQLFERLQEQGDDRDTLNDLVERIIAKWDITAGGEPLPPTVDALQDVPLPISLLQIVLGAVFEDGLPAGREDRKNASGRTSRNGSSRGATKASARNGTGSFERHPS